MIKRWLRRRERNKIADWMLSFGIEVCPCAVDEWELFGWKDIHWIFPSETVRIHRDSCAKRGSDINHGI